MKINKEDYFRIKRNILKKLYAHQAFSSGHLLYERLQSSIPSHLKGYAKIILAHLIKEQLVILYGKTKHGDAYQLNLRKLKEIEKWLLEPPK